MRTNKTTLHNTNRSLTALLLLPLLLMVSAPVQASIITIDFTAEVTNTPSGPIDFITGQYVLDTATPWGVDVGGVVGVITSATFTSSMFGTFNANVAGFTFAAAISRTGYGFLSLIGDYGSLSNFALDLTNNGWFPTANAYDVLTNDLALGDLRSFNPSDLDTTRFVNQIGSLTGVDVWAGALTSFSVMVPEPTTLWLMLLMLPGIMYWHRRRGA